METLEKTQIELPADLAKRYTEATTVEERNAVLFDFAKLQGAEDTRAKDAAVMTTEQGTKQASAASKQIGEAGETIRLLAEAVQEAAQSSAQIVATSGPSSARCTPTCTAPTAWTSGWGRPLLASRVVTA